MVELKCLECDHTDPVDLVGHIFDAHGMTVEAYLAKHPGADVETPEIAAKWAEYDEGIVRTPVTGGSYVGEVHGVRFRVNTDIPEGVCAPCPDSYHFPVSGEAGKRAKRVVRYIAERRSTWIYGSPGIGKDALVHHISHVARIPMLFYSIHPEARIQDWFWSLGFKDNSSVHIEGSLLKGLRDGYTIPSTGEVVPYLILLSDLDRASLAQVERLRTLLDTDTKRVPLPHGGYAEILEGTIIVATANTMGEGDETGRIVSARRVDSSILNRFERKVQMCGLDWDDQRQILTKAFPWVMTVLSEAGLVLPLKQATQAVQGACSSGELFAEFSLRDLRNIFSEFVSLVQMCPKQGVIPVENLLREAFDVYLDGLGLEHTRRAARLKIEDKFKGNRTWSGDTSHIFDDEIHL